MLSQLCDLMYYIYILQYVNIHFYILFKYHHSYSNKIILIRLFINIIISMNIF